MQLSIPTDWLLMRCPVLLHVLKSRPERTTLPVTAALLCAVLDYCIICSYALVMTHMKTCVLSSLCRLPA